MSADSPGAYAFETHGAAPLIFSVGNPYVWVSRRNENGEVAVWRNEAAAKRAFDAGTHGLYWKKQVQE